MTSLKYGISFLLVLLPGILRSASAQQADKYIIEVPEQMSEEEWVAFRKTIPRDGWVLLKYKEGNNLVNLSNKDYELSLRIDCTEGTQQPGGYLVEYSDAYWDGDFGGIDFISSRRDDESEIHFLLDGKDYGDPFATPGNSAFRSFVEALKRSSWLTISVYDFQFNPETGKEELQLNRSMDFKLAHSELLDIPVPCNE